MYKFIVFTILLTLTYANGQSTGSLVNESGYNIPCNTKFPYGDENQFNYNVLENDTNQVHCVEEKNLKELEGKCPITPENEGIVDPYTHCPDFDLPPSPHEIIFSSNQQQAPEVQCKKCDLKLTSEKSAVIVECFQCFDIPSPNRQANRTEKNILYKVYFIQIANYTSVDVSGREYL